MRLSRNQRDVLFLLIAFEGRGRAAPVPSADLLRIINGQRVNPVAGSNFRLGLKTLAGNGLVGQYRHPTKLTLAYSLTDEGRAHAEVVYRDRTQEVEECGS